MHALPAAGRLMSPHSKSPAQHLPVLQSEEQRADYEARLAAAQKEHAAMQVGWGVLTAGRSV